MMRLLIFRNDAPTRRRGDAPTKSVNLTFEINRENACIVDENFVPLHCQNERHTISGIKRKNCED